MCARGSDPFVWTDVGMAFVGPGRELHDRIHSLEDEETKMRTNKEMAAIGRHLHNGIKYTKYSAATALQAADATTTIAAITTIEAANQ